MRRNRDLFNREVIEGITTNHPFIRLFQKNDWPAYIELLAQIYDLFADGSKIEYEAVKSTIHDYYREDGPANLENKINTFMSMAISELEILKDSHDEQRHKFIESTSEGKNLLALCESMILSRKRFTGSGADTLLGALNNLMLYSGEMTQEEALTHHQEKIEEYKQDMSRINEDGILAAEKLGPGHSNEELFVQAEEAASQILTAGEDIIKAIERARKELMRKYRKQNVSAGQAIGYFADFDEELRKTPEYKSYARAGALLSQLKGIGDRYKYNDVSQLYHDLRNKNLLSQDLLRNSCLSNFTVNFDRLEKDIIRKKREQLNILRIQIYYAITNESKVLHGSLRDLLSLLNENGSHALEFLKSQKITFQIGTDLDQGPLRLHNLESETNFDFDALTLNEMDERDLEIMLEKLRKAEEATISRVVEKIQDKLSREGFFFLSDYETEYGITEYYVLSNVNYFIKGVTSKTTDSLINLPVSNKSDNQDFIIYSIQNRKIYLV